MKKLTYLDYAESDYRYLKSTYNDGYRENHMCAAMQNACEKFLKGILAEYFDMSTESDRHIMGGHQLSRVKMALSEKGVVLDCDWGKILSADGYYYSTRYPGTDSYMAGTADVDVCMEAMEETRRAVLSYFKEHPLQNEKTEDFTEQMDRLSEGLGDNDPSMGG